MICDCGRGGVCLGCSRSAAVEAANAAKLGMTGRDSAAERRALIDLDALRLYALLDGVGDRQVSPGELLALVEAAEAAGAESAAKWDARKRAAEWESRAVAAERERDQLREALRDARSDLVLVATEGWDSRRGEFAVAAVRRVDAALAPGTGAARVASGRATTEEGEPT